MPTVYQLDQVSRRFSNFPALVDLNLHIRTGERIALVGPSGAGKSTLIRLLNGTILPSEGKLLALGQDLSRLKPRELRDLQKKIGTIYQQFHLIEPLRVIHNVNAGHLGKWPLHKALFSLLRPQEVDKAIEALTQVGIPEKVYQTTGLLSGGQQQRVAIARVLVQQPKVILADEPVSSLDPERSREVLDLLIRLSRESGTTLISNLHAIEFATSHFERIIGLRDGKVFFDKPASDLEDDLIKDLYRITDRSIN